MSIAANSLHTLLFKGIAAGVVFAITVITARFLNTEERGIFAMLSLMASLFITIVGGIAPAMAYQISNRKESSQKIFFHSLIIGIIGSFITILVILLLYPWLSSIGWGFMIYFAVAAPFMIVVLYINGLLLGSNSVRTLNYISILSSFIMLLCFVILIILALWNIKMVMLSWLIAYIATAFIAIYISRRSIFPLGWNFDKTILKQLTEFGSKIGVINIIGQLNYRVDMFLVQFFLGFASVGIYSVSLITAESLWLISSSITVAAYSRIGSLDKSGAGELTSKIIRISILIVMLAGLLIALAGYFLIPVIFGNNYSTSIVPFEILLIGIIFYSIASPVSAYFTNQLGKPEISLAIAIVSLATTFMIGVLLIPRFGITGAALSTTMGYTLAVIVSLSIFLKISRQSLSSLLITGDELKNYFRYLIK